MNKQDKHAAKFFCENCGVEVKENARFCPQCGKFFSSTRCPQCGFTGSHELFTNGCPKCGYSISKNIQNSDITNNFSSKNNFHVMLRKYFFGSKKKLINNDDCLPGWIYILSVSLLISIIFISIYFFKNNL